MRFATVRLTAPAPLRFPPKTYRSPNGVSVEMGEVDTAGRSGDQHPETSDGPRVQWPYEHDITRVLLSATTDAGAPILRDGRLLVPKEPRAEAETALSELADMLAVTYQCRRAVRSPMAACALGPGGSGGDPPVGVAGLFADPLPTSAARMLPLRFDLAALAPLVSGRLDGLGMLADALSETSAVGRVRELFRLFERAFQRGPSSLVAPLYALLADGPRHDASQYTEAEVRRWMEQLRPESVHGDRREQYAREADAAPFLGRMEFAAYDVLLNKAVWRNPSPSRRNRVSFASAPAPDGGGAILLSPDATIGMPWLDAFGVYPRDWEARVTPADGWIWKLPGQDDVAPDAI